MIIILVRWFVKRGHEDKFLDTWSNVMKVPKEKGLYRETLTSEAPHLPDDRYHTFELGSPDCSTFINIGMWRSLDDFEQLIGQYIGEQKDFEYKMRERIVLKEISSRGQALPPAAMEE